MVAVANAGYRAIAIDYRGYGLSDQPPEPEKTTITEFAEDVIGILDSLSIHKVTQLILLRKYVSHLLLYKVQNIVLSYMIDIITQE